MLPDYELEESYASLNITRLISYIAKIRKGVKFLMDNQEDCQRKCVKGR